MKWSLPRSQRHPPGPADIRLALNDIRQLFNSMDPSPFRERDLDSDAEAFLVGWAHEYADHVPLSLQLQLREWPGDEIRQWVPQAIRHYFEYRARMCGVELSALFRRGRISLVIGLSFLTVCMLIGRVLALRFEGFGLHLLQESLTIIGWAAMWQPLQIYLYDWWPLAGRVRVYRRMAEMPIEVVPGHPLDHTAHQDAAGTPR